jgi:uncharacterized protein YdgA (DUF945 family)
MNKAISFVLLLVLLAAGISVAAWTTGHMVHTSLEDSERQALQDGNGLKVVSRQYHGGVFSSTETVVYGFDPSLARGNADAAAQLSQVQLTVQHVFHHGPFPQLRGFGLATVDSHLVVPPEVLAQLTGLVPGQQPLSLHTQFGWSGDGRSHLDAPAFDISFGHGNLLTWHGMKGDCDFNHALEHVHCRLVSDGLSMMDEQASGGMKQLDADFDMHRVLDQLYVGSSRMSLGAIELKRVPATELSLKDVRFASDSALNGDFLDFSGALDLGPVQSAEFTEQSAGLEVKFKHVHAASFAAMAKAARQQRAAADASPAALDEMLAPLKTYGTEIVLHQPRIELPRASLITADGALSLSGSAELGPVQRSELEAAAPMPALLQHLQAKLDFTVDEALAAKLSGTGAGAHFGARLADLQARGLVTRGGGKLSSHVEFNAGLLKVNGMPYAPP